MPFDQLFAFATFAYVASATPGPNNILLTAVGGAGGIRGGLPVLFGIVFGFSAMVFLLAFGALFGFLYKRYGNDAKRFHDPGPAPNPLPKTNSHYL